MPTPAAALWREWMNLQTNLVWIYEGPVPARNQRGAYQPDHLAAWLVLDGEVELRQPDLTVRAHAGQWLIPWPGYRKQAFSDDARILSVRFQCEWPDGKPLFERGLSVVLERAEHPRLESAARVLLAATSVLEADKFIGLSDRSLPFSHFIAIKTRLMEWLGVFYETLDAAGIKPSRIGIRDERVWATVQKLDSLPLSARILEDELAAGVGLGASQFVRVFRDAMDVTPKKYFDERRRNFCRRMLKNTGVPIKQVALELGFLRLSDFSAWFKDAHRVSPRRFREEAGRGFSV